MSFLWESFIAFNQNGFSFLIFTISNSFWYVIIAIAAVISIILALKETTVVTVKEEQQVI